MGADEQLFEQLNNLRGSKTLIVGIGNTLKGDDGAGPAVCQLLGEGKISAELIDAGSVPENYIQPIIKKAPQNLLIIDAIDFGAQGGTIRIFKPEQLDSLVISTQTLSPHLFVDMIAQAIEVEVYFIGIQPVQVRLGEPICPEVNRAIKHLVEVLSEIFPPQNCGR